MIISHTLVSSLSLSHFSCAPLSQYALFSFTNTIIEFFLNDVNYSFFMLSIFSFFKGKKIMLKNGVKWEQKKWKFYVTSCQPRENECGFTEWIVMFSTNTFSATVKSPHITRLFSLVFFILMMSFKRRRKLKFLDFNVVDDEQKNKRRKKRHHKGLLCVENVFYVGEGSLYEMKILRKSALCNRIILWYSWASTHSENSSDDNNDKR